MDYEMEGVDMRGRRWRARRAHVYGWCVCGGMGVERGVRNLCVLVCVLAAHVTSYTRLIAITFFPLYDWYSLRPKKKPTICPLLVTTNLDKGLSRFIVLVGIPS